MTLPLLCRRCLPIILLLALSFGGCKQGEKTSAQANPVPEDLKLTFGQSGGFAGRMMGYSIDAGGTVVRWEGKYPEENRQATSTLDQAQVQQLWDHATAIELLEMQEQVMDNIVWFVTVTAEGESRRVTWNKQDPEAPVQQFFNACMDLAKTALGEEGR